MDFVLHRASGVNLFRTASEKRLNARNATYLVELVDLVFIVSLVYLVRSVSIVGSVI